MWPSPAGGTGESPTRASGMALRVTWSRGKWALRGERVSRHRWAGSDDGQRTGGTNRWQWRGARRHMRRPGDRLVVVRSSSSSLTLAGCSGGSAAPTAPPPTWARSAPRSRRRMPATPSTRSSSTPSRRSWWPSSRSATPRMVVAQYGNLSIDLVAERHRRAHLQPRPQQHGHRVPVREGGFFTPVGARASPTRAVSSSTVPRGTVAAQLELLVHPTLRWRSPTSPPPGTAGTGHGRRERAPARGRAQARDRDGHGNRHRHRDGNGHGHGHGNRDGGRGPAKKHGIQAQQAQGRRSPR